MLNSGRKFATDFRHSWKTFISENGNTIVKPEYTESHCGLLFYNSDGKLLKYEPNKTVIGFIGIDMSNNGYTIFASQKLTLFDTLGNTKWEQQIDTCQLQYITSAVISSQADRIAVSYTTKQENKVKIYSQNGQELFSFSFQDSVYQANLIFFNENYLMYLSMNKMFLIDLSENKLMWNLNNLHNAYSDDILFFPNSNRIVILDMGRYLRGGNYNWQLILLNFRTGEKLFAENIGFLRSRDRKTLNYVDNLFLILEENKKFWYKFHFKN